jgi:hypothetical protein
MAGGRRVTGQEGLPWAAEDCSSEPVPKTAFTISPAGKYLTTDRICTFFSSDDIPSAVKNKFPVRVQEFIF